MENAIKCLIFIHIRFKNIIQGSSPEINGLNKYEIFWFANSRNKLVTY